MTDVMKAIMQIWPLLQEDWRTLLLVCVLLFCAGLLIWGAQQRKADRTQQRKDCSEIKEMIEELQETVDKVVEIHNRRHPEDAREFVQKLHQKQTKSGDTES